MKKPEEKNQLEDIAIRVMYFFNTMDTYMIASVLVYILGWYLVSLDGSSKLIRLFPAFQGNILITLAAVIVLYILLRMADFHPLFIPFSLLGLAGLILAGQLSLGACLVQLAGFYVITSVIQIAFMGIPMGIAARSPMVPLRIYMNSFIIIAPTTISLPLTLYYQVFLVGASSGLAHRPGLISLAFIVFVGISVLLTRRYRKKGFIPGTDHPENRGSLYKRVIILNIDGLSKRAFDAGNAPFMKSLERKYVSVEGGARTVYRALTNPAFASILSGVEPGRHGVKNNNFNQSIRTQALPDIVPARLYGSMHVRHFSRPEWNVTVVSLVDEGYQNADKVMMGKLRDDLLKDDGEVRLWVADLSEVDYCGHAWGSYSSEMARAVKHINELVQVFIHWLKDKEMFDDTLVIISSDHGLFIGEHSFILHPQEEFVPLVFVGQGISAAQITEPVSIIDIAANISYALGVSYCDGSKGRVFPEIFPSRH